MSATNTGTILLALIFVLVGASVFTLLPSASIRINDLGYASLCPFAPWSTLSLLLVAAFVWAIRAYLRDQAER